jgi:limonene-1,2-epoxide hydrolase
LRDDEAALFVQRIGAQEATWCPAGAATTAGGAEALALLRSLLWIEPGDRPRHAIAISRMIADVRDAMRSAAPRHAIWSFA